MRLPARLAVLSALALAGCAAQGAGAPGGAGGEEQGAELAAADAQAAAPGEQAKPAGASPDEPAAAGQPVLSDPGLMDALQGSVADADQAFAAAYDAPQIYMALQPDPGGPTSVILAIDESRDNTPSDDPAIRLTPENGDCNPQQLRYYKFPPERSERPAYGPDEAFRGITARELPDFMATAVTAGMLEAGLIDDPEQSQPQNVCTRKLLQWVIIQNSAG